MFQYGMGPRAARWVAAVLWIAFVGLLVLESVDADDQLVGHLPAAAVAYVMTLLVMAALPRRSLTDLVLVPVLLMLVPELIAAATQHAFGIMRMLWEMAAVMMALIPVKVDRVLRDAVVPTEDPLLGRITASAAGRRSRIFDLWPQKPSKAPPLPLASVRTTGLVHRLPERHSANEGE